MAALRTEIEAACAPHGLTVMGYVHDGDSHLALIGMTRQGWDVFTGALEYHDGAPNPLDRWSQRILTGLAAELRASQVVYPFGGPPYAPFIRWAFDSGETFQSPVGMLVHHRAGFWISFRGALRFDRPLEATPAQDPCPACAKPCVSACPVGAMAPDKAYDVPRCKSHIASEAGRECREGGCLVRRACPVGQSFGRDTAQSAFHMAAFLQA